MSEAQNIIFLDIDGPVLSPRFLMMARRFDGKSAKFNGLTKKFAEMAKDHFHLADPVTVMMITDLAHETNSKIVISSIWRLGGYEQFVEDFEDFGFDRDLLHEDWRTNGQVLDRREDEVQLWLDRHPEVKRFVTIDDEPLDFDSHIQVCAVNGFLVDNYDQAYEVLTGEESPLPINLYNHAAVDFYGPETLVENDESLKRCNQRLADRRAAIRKKYQPD